MISEKVRYRVRQFWQTLVPGKISPESLIQVKQILPDAQFKLFAMMQPSEQAHSLRVYNMLTAQGEVNVDLLTAALLHDVGKTRYPLRTWERVLIVLANAFIPELSKRWGSGEPKGLVRAFVISEKHPEWGADLAEDAGVSPMAVSLIRMHQDPGSAGDKQGELIELLARLQSIDNQN